MLETILVAAVGATCVIGGLVAGAWVGSLLPDLFGETFTLESVDKGYND